MTNNDDVNRWARGLGFACLDVGVDGLNRAISVACDAAAATGASRVIVAHADLPYASDLRVANGAGVVVVPDRKRSGTNVMSLPCNVGFVFSYGANSLARHRAEATRLGLDFTEITDEALAWDVDDPSDVPLELFDTRTPAQAKPTSMHTNLSTPESALAIGAHPDDIEFGCGATLAKWSQAGTKVHMIIITNGSKGTWDVNADTNELVKRRQKEQIVAAQKLGVRGEVTFLGHQDGELSYSVESRATLCRIIRQLRPDVVLGHDPWKRWRLHPDHRAAGWLTVDAVVAARDPHYHREHNLAHHRPKALLLFECEEPNLCEVVEESHVEAKVAALLAHESQFESTMAIDQSDDGSQVAAFRQQILNETSVQGQAVGVAHAESFRLIDPAS